MPNDALETKQPTEQVAPRKPLKARWQELMLEYGRLAVVVYFTLFFATWGGFALAMMLGLEVKGAGAATGTVVGSYVATKFTQPVRIIATLAVTPVLERLLRGWPRMHRWLMGA